MHSLRRLEFLQQRLEAEIVSQGVECRVVLDRKEPIIARGRRPVKRGGIGRASFTQLCVCGAAGDDPQARPMTSPVCVFNRTTSPSLMNRGTRTTSPVSSVACLVAPPAAVSPRRPSSVDETASSTYCGSCNETGSPLYFKTWSDKPSSQITAIIADAFI